MDCKYFARSNQLTNGNHQTEMINRLQEQLNQVDLQQYSQIQQTPYQQQTAVQNNFRLPTLLPIDDFYLLDDPNKYTDDEKQLRIKLTAVYRLIELNGWSMGIYNHVTVKLEKQQERILIHPFGLHYNEITASSLLKIDMKGNIVDQGSTNFELNRPGYIIHSAIHLARPDLKAIIHLHYPPVAAASTCKYGLLPICQEQALLGEIAYLDYSGILTQEDERDAVAAGLGKTCKVMILRNHGLIVCGETIEEAYYLLTNLMRACETQARVLALGGLNDLVLMNESAAQQAYQTVQSSRYPIKQWPMMPTNEVERHDESTTSGNESDLEQTDIHHHKAPKNQLLSKKSSAGLRKIIGYVNMYELDFEANMRSLDLAGHQTGYKFKRPLFRNYRRV